MARIMWACWDGGGNLTPSLGIARVLETRGHEVHFFGRPDMVHRVEAAGFGATALDHARTDLDRYSFHPMASVFGFTSSPAVGEELVEVAQQWDPDVVVIDAMFASALNVAPRFNRPTAVMLHIFFHHMIDSWRGNFTMQSESRQRAGFDGLPDLDAFKKNRLRRLHRKVSVIDGSIGFVGGINIIDDFNVPKGVPPRIDYALRIEGSLLPAMLASVNKLWRRIAFIHLQPIVPKTKSNPTHTTHHDASQGIKAAFVMRDNVLHRRDIENAYLAAITHAHHEIIIANAYFVPGRRFRKALLNAAKRGVKVKLLLQGRLEYFLMFATHAFYGVFLDNGIEIYEYRKGYMHSKVAVIDSEWATVGSSNIDPFSLLLAREANVMVKDKTFATELHADITLFIQDNTYQVLPKEWASGHSIKRFISWLAYGMVRVFVGLIGYSKGQ